MIKLGVAYNLFSFMANLSYEVKKYYLTEGWKADLYMYVPYAYKEGQAIACIYKGHMPTTHEAFKKIFTCKKTKYICSYDEIIG